jgi:hypothetical protein
MKTWVGKSQRFATPIDMNVIQLLIAKALQFKTRLLLGCRTKALNDIRQGINYILYYDLDVIKRQGGRKDDFCDTLKVLFKLEHPGKWNQRTRLSQRFATQKRKQHATLCRIRHDFQYAIDLPYRKHNQ